jgi:hypothetical protein
MEPLGVFTLPGPETSSPGTFAKPSLMRLLHCSYKLIWMRFTVLVDGGFHLPLVRHLKSVLPILCFTSFAGRLWCTSIAT